MWGDGQAEAGVQKKNTFSKTWLISEGTYWWTSKISYIHIHFHGLHNEVIAIIIIKKKESAKERDGAFQQQQQQQKLSELF